ncbi:uncharacterized protein C8Q71DRAFT_718439, partial [Rhodofomes roseus]
MGVAALVPLLNYRNLKQLAHTHRVALSVGTRSRLSVVRLLLSHTCSSSCGIRYAVFVSTAIYVPTALPLSESTSNPTPATIPVVSPSDTGCFPPPPLGKEDVAHIVADWCDSINGSSLIECPCAVCGELVLGTSVSTVLRDGLDLSPLVRRGVSAGLAQEPILYPPAVHVRDGLCFLDVCSTCLNGLRHHLLPRRALANGLWVGDVPLCLQSLTFVEKLVISKYRHNACVVEVNQGKGVPGQRKMRANAIIFPQPIGNVYTVLPPPREDLDEVLAILFIGPCVPSEPDYRRTPLLVRHRVIVEALNWLISNHSLYSDVEISYTNLSQYLESEPPVSVLHKTTDGLRPAEGMSVYDQDGELGADSGPCEFVVQSLSADQLVDM